MGARLSAQARLRRGPPLKGDLGLPIAYAVHDLCSWCEVGEAPADWRAAERAGAVAPRAPAFGDRGLDPCSRREVGEAPAGGLSARARLHALEPLGPETDRDSLTKGCEGGAPPPQTRRGSADCAARFGRCRAEKSVRGWVFGWGKIMAQCTMASPYEATKGAQNETHVVVPGQYVERRRLASFA